MSGAAAALMYSTALHLFPPITPLLIIITAHSIVPRHVGALFSGVASEGEAVWSSSHGRDKGLLDLPARLASCTRPAAMQGQTFLGQVCGQMMRRQG